MDEWTTGEAVLRKNYAEIGFAACPNVVSSGVANDVRELFLSADYDHIQQVRKRHYSHVQKMDDPLLPKEGEVYRASFSRSNSLERQELIKRLTETELMPLVARISGKVSTDYELRAYRMDAGDLLRLHVDDYVAEVGFIYYLSTEWRWDWGGILSVVRGDTVSSIAPTFNQLVVINHGLRLPHFVSQITDYALQPRYMLVGLCR